ncbi:unnamed protein product [Calicophoron daubneyi]|uniref:Large ribosomal subunit protein mL46 N-terminal domain-containing protein n=1 Tax=Calicophoron daubneyi TaxID=300641 RepID=A0AAV2T4S0_CALDB
MTASTTRSLAGVKAWKLFSGLCIKRPAVIVPELSPLERKVSELYSSIEFEKSFLSSHELRDQQDQVRLSKALEQQQHGQDKQYPAATPSDQEGTTLQTAREKELQWQSEAERFKPANRTTENDRSNNLRSAWRMLDRPLVLIVKQSLGGEPPSWGLPLVSLKGDENLRQAADGLVTQSLPSAAKCRIFGNTPSAVHVYKFRDKQSGERFGAQLYFFHAYVNRLWHGSDIKMAGVTDFAWITRDHMNEYVDDPKLLKVLNSFIFEY